MGGRSAAAKGSTLEPPGRPPRPSNPVPAEPPEPRSEPGPRSLLPTERSPRAPGHFSPEQTRRSGSPTGSTRQQRGRELTPRRSSSCNSSEPGQPPGSTSGRERKKRPPSGGRGPNRDSSARFSPDTPTPRSHWSLRTPAPSRPRLHPQRIRPRKSWSQKQPDWGS